MFDFNYWLYYLISPFVICKIVITIFGFALNFHSSQPSKSSFQKSSRILKKKTEMQIKWKKKKYIFLTENTHIINIPVVQPLHWAKRYYSSQHLIVTSSPKWILCCSYGCHAHILIYKTKLLCIWFLTYIIIFDFLSNTKVLGSWFYLYRSECIVVREKLNNALENTISKYIYKLILK